MSGIAASLPRRFITLAAQRPSHVHLSLDVSGARPPSPRSRAGHLDAIVVPATKPASFLQPAINLAASLDTLLVILSSKRTSVEQVAQRVGSTPGARCLIVRVAEGWTHPALPSRSSDSKFHAANAGRSSDLSLKRNLGLLLARSHGWNKIVFIDDDIRLSSPHHVARLAVQLERYQVAGMSVRRFPDNSVVCHARRLSGLSQDVFVTGAVLGVHCNSLPLSFFPDIYNEDWFFFAKEAARRMLPRVGDAVQSEYDPFARSDRARWEEFGDLLAEGLFSYFDECDETAPFDELLGMATRTYWSQFIEARRRVLLDTHRRLLHFADQDPGNYRIRRALDSLNAAQFQLENEITPDLCTAFIAAWREDLAEWQRTSTRVNTLGSTGEAMDFLQLEDWSLATFGNARVKISAGRP